MLTDLTTGSPSKLIIKFTLPMLFSMVFQQLYGIADLIIAGKYVGIDALAAIGASVPVTMIFMAIANGLNIGCSVVISQLFGSKDFTKTKTAVYTSLVGVLSAAAVLTVLGITFCGVMLTALNTPENVFGDAALYLNIYMGGLVFLFLYNICNGIFTALGDSKTPLGLLVVSSVFNVILTLYLVVNLQMGVAGAAWATFICQGMCSLIAFAVLLFRIREIRPEVKPQLFSGKMMLRISRIAIPSILQQSFVSVGNLFIQGIINSFGSEVIAGFSAASRINVLALAVVGSFGNGLSAFTAQNIGAGKHGRVKEGYRAAMLMMVVLVSIFTVFYLIFSNNLISLFVDTSAGNIDGAVNAGSLFLRIVSPFYVVVCAKLIADGVLRGTGSMMYFMIATFADLILRVLLAFLLTPFLGETGICLSWAIGWIIGFIFSRYFYCKITRNYARIMN